MEDTLENSNQPMNTDGRKKQLLIFGIIIFSVVAVLLLVNIIQMQRNLTYNSQASGRVYPTIPVKPSIPYPTLTVTPGPINSVEGLNQALDELENANVKAVNAIQSQINQTDTDSAE